MRKPSLALRKPFPDLVLMDVQLKGRVDGITAASVIRDCFDIPVIYLTALSDDVTVERAEKTFPLGYLLKPVAEKELHIAVKLALQSHGCSCAKSGRVIFPIKRNLWARRGWIPSGVIAARHPPSSSRRWSEAGLLSPVKPPPLEIAIQEQLKKILSSRTLAQSKRLVRFLSFVVKRS